MADLQQLLDPVINVTLNLLLQVPGFPALYNTVTSYPADPRVLSWPFMASIHPTLLCCICYIVGIPLLKAIMNRRAAFELKPVLVLHNGFLFLLSLYMTVETCRQAYLSNYGAGCMPVDHSENGLGMAKVLYIYYLSKLYEYGDTILMVLRKKMDQVSFLHLYHHVTMFFLWWFGIYYSPGGSAWFSAALNSFVHVIMYFYYLLATFGIQPWWKRYITQLQMVQFVLNIVHAVYGINPECRFPQWMMLGMVVYMCSFLVLFGNFYVQAYLRGKRDPTKRAASAVRRSKKSE